MSNSFGLPCEAPEYGATFAIRLSPVFLIVVADILATWGLKIRLTE